MSKYQNKYRIESNRLRNWDYSSSGCYFLTICTQNRIHWFGEVKNGAMVLSDFGWIIHEQWIQSFAIRDECSMGEFIVMPNHIHGIVILDNDPEIDDVETHGGASLRRRQKQPSLYRKPKSISSFMAGFKAATMHEIDDYIDSHHLDMKKFNRQNRLWQRNYWDRIIRNKKEYDRIAKYITSNPFNWENDQLYR